MESPLDLGTICRTTKLLAISTKVTEAKVENLEWTQGIIKFLNMGELSTDKEETKKKKRRAVQFVKIDDFLYKSGYSTLFLRCFGP